MYSTCHLSKLPLSLSFLFSFNKVRHNTRTFIIFTRLQDCSFKHHLLFDRNNLYFDWTDLWFRSYELSIEATFRAFIKFFCRRSVEFFSWAVLVLLMKESKKRRRKQPGKLMATCNSRSQPVNLPVAQAGQFAHCPALNELPEPLIELTRYQW